MRQITFEFDDDVAGVVFCDKYSNCFRVRIT